MTVGIPFPLYGLPTVVLLCAYLFGSFPFIFLIPAILIGIKIP